LKVLFITKYYPPSEGGIERYGQLLCNGLVQQGIEVEVVAVVCERSEVGRQVVDGVIVHRLKAHLNISSTPITLALPIFLRKRAKEFDVLHFNFPYPWTDVLYRAFYSDKKTVITYHCDIFRAPGTVSGKLLRLYRPIIRSVLSKMPSIITSSPNLIKQSPFLYPNRDRCHVIPMPVDLSLFEKPALQEMSLIKEKYGSYALFVGRLVPYKGVAHLIEGITKVNGVNLVIVGRGPLEDELRKQVSQLELDNRVFFLGKVSDEKLCSLYHGCACFVLPSISHAEGFGIVQAEAMACGAPSISTELQTGTSYVNKDGVTGYVVPPADADALAEKIEILATDENRRNEMGRAGRLRVRAKFSKEEVVMQTIKTYESLLKGESGSN
jgi:glycosyltransferase involved in cell wall biosynthesis